MKMPRIRIMMTVTVLIWTGACAVALAQSAGGAQGPSQMDQQPTPTAGPSAPGAPTAPDSYTPNTADPQTFADQAFLRKTLEDNVGQEQMGQLAQQKSQSEDVKQFGEKMTQIHQQLTHQITPLAQKLGVSQPKEPSKKDREEIQKMQSLSGTEFDSAFVRAMLRLQKSDLKEFKNEEGSSNPGVQQVAKLDDPILAEHLKILEKIAQSHNVTEQSSK
jgi:putative membrane protein